MVKQVSSDGERGGGSSVMMVEIKLDRDSRKDSSAFENADVLFRMQ